MWSDPNLWYPWIKVGAFIAGLVVGAVAIFSPSWVWLKKQLISYPAAWLATLGCAMVSMSIWQSVQIEGAGFKASITGLQARFDSLDNATEEIARNIEQVQQAIARQRASTEQLNERFDVGLNYLYLGERPNDPAVGRPNDPAVAGNVAKLLSQGYFLGGGLRAIIREPQGPTRTRLLVSYMLQACVAALPVEDGGKYGETYSQQLLSATTEEAAWAVLEDCTARLKPKP